MSTEPVDQQPPSPETPADTIRRLRAENQRLQAENTKLQELALIDPVTGIFNRRYLDREMEKLQGIRAINSATVLIVDIDYFKRINDQDGHPAGDQALRTVAQKLSLGIRPEDTVARFGGDEFVIILPNLHKDDDVHNVLLRLHNEISPTKISISMGFGTAIRDEQDQLDLKQALADADKELYRAKGTKED